MANRDLSVTEQLLTEGYRFDFFQAVRLLNRIAENQDPVGYASLPQRESVRFHSLPSLNFPPSAICDITRSEDHEEPIHMVVAFMGLTGPQGVMPRYYTELIMERLRYQDRTMLDFFDLFSHRMVSLFYRSWEKYHVAVSFEGAATQGKKSDRIFQHMLSLIGLGTKGLVDQLAFPPQALLGYTGLLSLRSRPAHALRQILSHFFGVVVDIRQFIGQWVALEPEDQSRLNGPKRNLRLGETTIAGSQIWDQQARFHVEIGPLSLTRFAQFLPSGKTYHTLVQLIRFFAGQHLQFDIRLLLQAAEVPYCRLSETSACPPRLGWTTWLKCEEFTHDAEDVMFQGELAPVTL